MPADPKPKYRKPEKQKCRVVGCPINAAKDKNGFCSGHYKQVYGRTRREKAEGRLDRKIAIRKKGKSELSKWRRKARAIFQKWVRLRDADENGVVFCITCNKPVFWKGGGCDAGHFRPATCASTLFDERNVNGQCSAKCNANGMQKSEVIEYYAYKIDKKYGEGTAEEITKKSHQTRKIGVIDYMAVYEHYKKEFEKLKKERKSKGWVI
jgi:hypothetical protein